MKCPECSGNNCYWRDEDAEPYFIEEDGDMAHLECEVECYDCGNIFMWDWWE